MDINNVIISLTIDARSDLKNAFTYYSDIDRDLANKFIATIDQYFEKIKLSPFGSSIQYDEIRVKPIMSFPFTIHYTVLDKENILILRIFNTFQKPFW